MIKILFYYSDNCRDRSDFSLLSIVAAWAPGLTSPSDEDSVLICCHQTYCRASHPQWSRDCKIIFPPPPPIAQWTIIQYKRPSLTEFVNMIYHIFNSSFLRSGFSYKGYTHSPEGNRGPPQDSRFPPPLSAPDTGPLHWPGLESHSAWSEWSALLHLSWRPGNSSRQSRSPSSQQLQRNKENVLFSCQFIRKSPGSEREGGSVTLS